MKPELLVLLLVAAAAAPALAITPANVQQPSRVGTPTSGPKTASALAITPANIQQPSSVGTPTPGPKTASANTTEAAKQADDRSGLRRGVVQQVDFANSVFHVFGQPVPFDVTGVRVVGADGKQTTIYALKQGANVRFTLDPADPKHQRAAVIYVN
jgi:hypothetical protein